MVHIIDREDSQDIFPDSYAAIDLETTGLNPKLDRIIEIGAIRVIDGKVVQEFSSFVNPGRRLEGKVTQLTGITDEMVEGAPEISELIGKVINFCQNLPLLGHQVIFDYSFLKRAAVNSGFDFEKTGIDTLKLCRRFMPEECKKNLADASRYFGVKQESAHRALADARTAHLLYQAIEKRYFLEQPDAFYDKPLIFKIKKEQTASKKQKEVLRDLIKYHKINLTVQIDSLSKNEVSRMTDKIISQYGRIKEVT